MDYYAGLDASKDETAVCLRDDEGGIVAEFKCASTGDALWTSLEPYRNRLQRVVLETGMLSSFLYTTLIEKGLPMVCIDARRAWAVMRQMPNKTDANDVAMLAELARSGFFRRVHVKGEEAQAMRTLLKARGLIV